MAKKTTVAIAHSGADLGKPVESTRKQLELVTDLIRQIADQTMGGGHRELCPAPAGRAGIGTPGGWN
jgi:hypothetical protein